MSYRDLSLEHLHAVLNVKSISNVSVTDEVSLNNFYNLVDLYMLEGHAGFTELFDSNICENANDGVSKLKGKRILSSKGVYHEITSITKAPINDKMRLIITFNGEDEASVYNERGSLISGKGPHILRIMQDLPKPVCEALTTFQTTSK